MFGRKKDKELKMPETFTMLTEEEQRQISDSPKPLPKRATVKIKPNITELDKE